METLASEGTFMNGQVAISFQGTLPEIRPQRENEERDTLSRS